MMNKQQISSQMICVEKKIKIEKRVYQREETVAVRESRPSLYIRKRRNKRKSQKTKPQSFWKKMKCLRKWINRKNVFLIITIMALFCNTIISNKNVSNLELIAILQFIWSIIFGKPAK